MAFQYLFVFPFLQEASKKEYKFSFPFPHHILLLKVAQREQMQWENKVKGYEFSKIGTHTIAFHIPGCESHQTPFFFFSFKKRNLNTVAYISTRVSFINCFHRKFSEMLAFCSPLELDL